MSNSSESVNGGASLVRQGPNGLATGTTATEGAMGERSLARSAETAITAAAEQARATIQAMYVVAQQRPRNIMRVRETVLADCLRPGFARVARYKKPVGGGKFTEGPSIRFAEAALRAMGNVRITSPVVFDDAERRLIHVLVTDLETNATYESEILIEKEVERKDATGRIVLGSRENTRKETTYRVVATEDEVRVKQNAEISKAIRTSGLRLVPGDVVEDCMRQVIRTLANSDAQDPEQARKDVADAFFDIGIKLADIEAYLGHPLATATPDELADLWSVGGAVKDKETTWREVMAMKAAEGVKVTQSTPDPSAQSTATKPTEKLREKAAARTGQVKKVDGLLASLAKVAATADAVATWWNENEPTINDLGDEEYGSVKAACEKHAESKTKL